MKLVRCKDCIFSVKYKRTTLKCVLNGLIWVEFDFCSYGKDLCDDYANRGIAKMLEERDSLIPETEEHNAAQ